jgi:hypothetical protein
MLEIVFDVLEGNPISFTKSSVDTSAVLRYLRSIRNVLHRGISWGNALYFDEQATLADAEYIVSQRKCRSASSSISSKRGTYMSTEIGVTDIRRI